MTVNLLFDFDSSTASGGELSSKERSRLVVAHDVIGRGVGIGEKLTNLDLFVKSGVMVENIQSFLPSITR
jgi:hypothetical protein